jgi:hypothetical protein
LKGNNNATRGAIMRRYLLLDLITGLVFCAVALPLWAHHHDCDTTRHQEAAGQRLEVAHFPADIVWKTDSREEALTPNMLMQTVHLIKGSYLITSGISMTVSVAPAAYGGTPQAA